jgi:hypothetical protein
LPIHSARVSFGKGFSRHHDGKSPEAGKIPAFSGAGNLLLDAGAFTAFTCPVPTYWMKENPLHFNKKRPRRFKGRPGVSANPNSPDSADMDPNAEESGDPSMEVVQDIAEAVMAEQDRSEAEGTAPAEASADSADEASGASSPPPQSPNPQQRQPQQAQRDPQAQAQAAQQRREQEQQRREQENARRQQEQQRREQERLRREEENRRREADRLRREAEDRARMPIDDLCKKAWKIYLAEVSEEGVELFPDNDARELARRSFRLAEIFMQEEMRVRRPPPPPARDQRPPQNGNSSAPQGDASPPEGQPSEQETPASPAETPVEASPETTPAP